jgi:hypothetical protein
MDDHSDPLHIGYNIMDDSKEIAKMLVVGIRVNGSAFSYDTGISIEEAKELCSQFIAWMNHYIGKEIERASNQEG